LPHLVPPEPANQEKEENHRSLIRAQPEVRIANRLLSQHGHPPVNLGSPIYLVRIEGLHVELEYRFV
jgi:hypothetical protein